MVLGNAKLFTGKTFSQFSNKIYSSKFLASFKFTNITPVLKGYL